MPMHDFSNMSVDLHDNYFPQSECPKWTRQKLNDCVCYNLESPMSLLSAPSIGNNKVLMSAQIQGKVEIDPTYWCKKCWQICRHI